jgi:hypothetical protein
VHILHWLEHNLDFKVRFKEFSRFIYICSPTILWTLLIFILIGLPGFSFPPIENNLLKPDNIVHFAIFFQLGLICYFNLSKQSFFRQWRNNPLFYTLFYCFFISGITEILQGVFFVQRTADIFDHLYNTLGAIAGTLFFKNYFLK